MPAVPSLDEIITEVETWFSEHIRKPPIAHDVAVYNQAYAAAEHLKARLVEMFTGKPAVATVPAVEEPQSAATAPSKESKPTA
jgi:hypothetical protein